MASSSNEKTKDALSELECLRAITVRNLPSDATTDLLHCLFPEASEIRLNIDGYGKPSRRSSVIIFPKVSNALYYADHDRSIKLDQNLLSIQSLVHPDSAASSSRKEHRGRERDRGQPKGHIQEHPSETSHGGSYYRSSSHRHSRSNRRSLSPPHHSRHDDGDYYAKTHREVTDLSRFSSWFGKGRHILVRNIPSNTGKLALFNIIPTAKDIFFHEENSNNDTLAFIVEFYSEREAESFIKRRHDIQLDRNVLFMEPYWMDRVNLKEDFHFKPRSPSPISLRRRMRSPPPHRLSPLLRSRTPPLRSRTPPLRSRTPPLRRHSPLHRSRSPLHRVSTKHRSLLPRYHSPPVSTPATPPRHRSSVHSESRRNRFSSPLRSHKRPLLPNPTLSHSPRDSKTSLNQKHKIQQPPQNDRFHYIVSSEKSKETLEERKESLGGGKEGGSGGDRRFVSLTGKLKERFSSKNRQWNRHIDGPQTELDKKNNPQVKDVFNQFKVLAKKFASENPDSARALNELLVSLGHDNKDPSSLQSPLEDLQKALSPEDDKLHPNVWESHEASSSHQKREKKKSDSSYSEIPKLSSVLKQVKDLSQNLGILSQLSKLAKHLKSNRSDLNATSIALSTLGNLALDKQVSSNNEENHNSRSNYNKGPPHKRDTDHRVSSSQSDKHFYKNSQENQATIDYNHQKSENNNNNNNNKMKWPDQASCSAYRKESNYETDRQYEDNRDFKDRHYDDYGRGNQTSHHIDDDYGRGNQTSHHIDDDYGRGNQSSHHIDDDYGRGNQSSHQINEGYGRGNQSSHHIDDDYGRGNQSSHHINEDYGRGNQSSHHINEDYGRGNQSSHHIDDDYGRGNQSSHHINDNYGRGNQTGHHINDDYGRGNQTSHHINDDYGRGNQTSHHINDERNYEQLAPPPFQESYHNRDNWHQQNLEHPDEFGPRDPREFGLMDHDDRVHRMGGSSNQFPHDIDNRFDQRFDMRPNDNYHPDHLHSHNNNNNNFDERRDNMSQLDNNDLYVRGPPPDDPDQMDPNRDDDEDKPLDIGSVRHLRK